ncbi:MAG: Calx-beta domain-containing protein [Verrucomicrobiota bacterium]
MNGVSGRLSAQESGPVISLSPVRVVEGHSGISTVQIPVYLSAAADGPVTVQWATADGTATAGSDYTAATGTLTFAPGETFKTVAVDVSGDTIAENDEHLTLRLSNPSGGTLGDSRTGVLIRDDEPVTSVQPPSRVSLFESPGTGIPPQLAVTNPVAGRSLQLSLISGTGTAGTDIVLTRSDVDLGTGTPALPLATADDGQQNGDRTFSLSIGEPEPGVRLLPSGLDQTLPPAPAPAAMALEGDLLVTADGTDLKILRRAAGMWGQEAVIPGGADGGVLSVAVSQGVIAADFRNTGVKILTRNDGGWSVRAAVPLTAPAGGYRRKLALQDDTLVIGEPAPGGQTAVSGGVRIHERHAGGRDAWGERQVITPPSAEPDFGGSLSLWGDYLLAGAPGSYAVSLLKRGAPDRRWALLREFVRFVPNFGKSAAINGDTLVISQDGALLTSRRTDSEGNIWSDLTGQNVGTGVTDPQLSLNGPLLFWKNGENFIRFQLTTGAGPWIEAGGLRPPPNVPALPRQLVSDGKTVVVTGSGDATAATLLSFGSPVLGGLILDDESIIFTADSVTLAPGFQSVPVRLSRPLPVAVAVRFTLVSGTAIAGTDFAADSQMLSFQAGETMARAQFAVYNPAPEAGARTFGLKLSEPSAGTVGPDAVITMGTPVSELSMETESVTVPEGNSGTQTISVGWKLSAPAPAGASFLWMAVGETARAESDFSGTSGTVSIPSGTTAGSFSVLVNGDTLGEWDERFYVTVFSPTGLKLSSLSTRTTIHITNDDSGIPQDDTWTMLQGTVLSGMDVRVNDTRVEEVAVVGTVSAGTLTLYSNGGFIFTPPPNFIGQASFQYADRFVGGARPATVTIQVTDANLPPALRDDNYNVKEDTVLTAGTGLFNNDGLLDSGGAAYNPILEMSVQEVENGTLTSHTVADGRFVFTPAPDFGGIAGFRYRLRDKDGWSAPARVIINVADDCPIGPLQRLDPLGSQLYRAAAARIVLPSAGVADYPLNLKAGQTVSMRAVPVSGQPKLGRLEIRDAAGGLLTGGTAGVNSLENVPVPADGRCTILAGDLGVNAYISFSVLVNGGLPQNPGQAASPYPLDSTRPAGSPRAAVSAPMTGSGAHYYAFDGKAGETVQLYLQSTAAPHSFNLHQPPGTIVASSTVSASDPRASSVRFTLPADGPCHAVVRGISGAEYTLQLYRGTDLPDHAAPVLPGSPSHAAGYLSGRGVPGNGPPEEALIFGAFGDYGSGSENEEAVATMVKSWNPDFLLAVGDHNYATDYTVGTPSWNTRVGRFYGDFIRARADNRYPEQTSQIQRFFPVPGNHDTGPDVGNGGELSSYFDYLHSNPGGTPRLPAGVHQPRLSYYKMTWGNADFFCLDSDNAAADAAALAVQRQWLRDQIRASAAQWKFGVWHHPPFSSSSVHGSQTFMQWGADFEGLTAVFTGHDHTYERIDLGYGVTQFVVGTGGNSLYSLSSNPAAGSLFRYNSNYGALKVLAGAQGVRFEFRVIGSAGGNLVDSHTIGTPPGPVIPSGSDLWSLRVQPGQTLRLSTRTPQPPGALTNTVNPLLELIDASGAVAARDAGSAPDGINAALTFTVPAIPDAPPEGALWSVRVANESAGSGEYELLVTQPAAGPYDDWAAASLPSLPAGPQEDPDGDGAPNLMEFLAGSDPRLPASSAPVITSLNAGKAPQLQINLPAEWTRPVTAALQSSPSLDNGSWTTVASKAAGGPWVPSGAGGAVPEASPAADGGFLFTPRSASGARQFYRLFFSLK